MLPAFVITFREGLEAALIIAIVVAYLIKIGRHEAKKYVWIGSLVAILLSAGIGYGIFVTSGTLEGVPKQLFEGTATLFATIVLTTMIFWMAKNAKNIKQNLHKKIDTAITKKYMFGLALLSFIAIFREGVETVLFLTMPYASDPSGTLLGTAIGILVVLLLGFVLLKGTVRLPLKEFFKYTGILLIVFAAGLFGYGIHELIEAGEGLGYNFGFWSEHAYDINPPDKENLLHEKGIIGSIAKGLVGYDGNPEWLRVFAYLGYWLVIGGYVFRTYRKADIPITNQVSGEGTKTL